MSNKCLLSGLGRIGLDSFHRVAHLPPPVRVGAQATVGPHVRVAARRGVSRVPGAGAGLQLAVAV